LQTLDLHLAQVLHQLVLRDHVGHLPARATECARGTKIGIVLGLLLQVIVDRLRLGRVDHVLHVRRHVLLGLGSAEGTAPDILCRDVASLIVALLRAVIGIADGCRVVVHHVQAAETGKARHVTSILVGTKGRVGEVLRHAKPGCRRTALARKTLALIGLVWSLTFGETTIHQRFVVRLCVLRQIALINGRGLITAAATH
jgi:hypothetical protein